MARRSGNETNGSARRRSAPYVATLTEKIVAWLNPSPDGKIHHCRPEFITNSSLDEIIDVDCGEGRLTTQISRHVRRIVGIDASSNMIASFHSNYPEIVSRVVDCRFLSQEDSLTNGSFDKVFSNAALHWILRDENTRVNFMKACFDTLKPGGKFVSESGALGNVAEVHAALIGELVHRGVPRQKALELSPWWFPSIEAMRSLVESAGFQWIRGEIELRQTKLTENEEGGIAGW